MAEYTVTFRAPDLHRWGRPLLAILGALVAAVATWGLLQPLADTAAEGPAFWSLFLLAGTGSMAYGWRQEEQTWMIAGATLTTLPVFLIGGDPSLDVLSWVGLLAPAVGLHRRVGFPGRVVLLFTVFLGFNAASTADVGPEWLLLLISYAMMALYTWREDEADWPLRAVFPVAILIPVVMGFIF